MTPQERFRSLRQQLGLTQKEMADRLMFKPTSISGIETGGKTVSPRALALLQSEFRVNPRWIEFGEEPQFIPYTEEENIDRLVKEHQLKPEERAVLLAFIKLDPETREAMLRGMKELVKSLSEGEAEQTAPAASEPNQLTDEEAHRLLQRQLDEQKEASAVSGSGNLNTA